MPLTRAEIKKVAVLKTKKGRREAGQFAVEGVRLLEQAVRHKTLPQIVYHASSVLSQRGLDLIDKLTRRNIDTRACSAAEAKRMSSAESSPGILAVFSTPPTNLDELYQPEHRNILLCENLGDPGNLGTLCRSALAFGFGLVILAGKCVEPYSPKVVRSSVGDIFGLKVAVVDTAKALRFASKQRLALIAANVHGEDHMSKALTKLKGKKYILVLGAEADGLTAQIAHLADFSVRIRHSSRVDSLNTAVAGSILMKEAHDFTRRR